MSLLPVVTPAQVATWDRLAVEDDRPLRLLMETAGRAVARVSVERHRTAAGQGVLVATGPGNNGGDGWVAARALHVDGWPVWVAESGEPSDGIAREARAMALADGVRSVDPAGPWPGVGLVIDALLGTGARGAPRAAMVPLLSRLAELQLPVVAVDGPTGLDLATGVDHGVLPARLTVTFGGVRRGHLLARDDCGELVVVDVGLPFPPPEWPRLVTGRWAARHLPPLPASAHKGTRGRVVIVGGGDGMTGAARLAARAAFAAGAGLVHVVAPPASIEVLRVAEPDVQTLAHSFAVPLTAELLALLDRADAVVVGPGLGRAAGRSAFVHAVITASRAVVIDADALVALQGTVAELADLGRDRAIVLTPHAGEFRTLFPTLATGLEVDPWAAAGAAAAAAGATVLLKGVPTVVAASGGGMLTVAAGNPGLATGGSGDVLSGLIGAFLARELPADVAAAVGAQALGESADHAARRIGARMLRPMDVIAACGDVWRGWAAPAAPAGPSTGLLLDLPAPRTV